jgi:serine/threonine protein kinase/tetratricopeptide (TPR) repeat protein
MVPDETLVPGSAAGRDGVERPGDEIGPYRLVSPLGEGGFGAVWLAERRQPFVQRVALKIIKPGMDSKAVVARFEQERQSLAVMAHPGIARVLDGGLTAMGRPYFVMEYVRGKPITEFADERRLAIRDRLRLFVQVCEAVQHAHLKGVIHRDLKPTNILAFDVEGGEPSVKVIDFGIAKATQHAATAQTVFTETGQMIGTPEYMSPEQADPAGEDIDTRSDVYSLGVVLYELLSGVTPLDPRELRSKAYREQQRIIAESDPPAPSTRLSTVASGDASQGARVAERRRVPFPDLVRSLRRELEWIPLKAMRRERQDRYQSATDLARDVRNYLEGKALVAGPEGAWYRVRKFVRRHRGMVAATAAVAAALVLGLGLALWQWRAAVHARDEADQRGREAVAVKDFVVESLVAADPMQGGRRDLTVKEAMAAAIAKLEAGALRDQPETEAALQLTISTVLAGSADFDRAARLADAAVRTLERVHGPDDIALAQALNNLASIQDRLGRSADAEALHRRALAIREQALGPGHGDVAFSLNNLASVLWAQGRTDDAMAMFERALAIRERAYGPAHPAVGNTINNMAVLNIKAGKLPEAEALLRRALAVQEATSGPDHPDLATAISNLAYLCDEQKKHADAEALGRRALAIREKALGPGHPEVAGSLNNLAWSLNAQGKRREARECYVRALAIWEPVRGASDPQVVKVRGRIAEIDAVEAPPVPVAPAAP